MTNLGIAVDYPSLCELLIIDALIKEGNCPKILYQRGRFESEELGEVPTVINRMVDRVNRLDYTERLASNGIRVLNPYSITDFCKSKLQMKRAFDIYSVRTAPWVISDHPLTTVRDGTLGFNWESVGRISETIREIGYPIIIKPTDGSRGISILKIDNDQSFEDPFVNFASRYRGQPPSNVPMALYKNPINPQGMLIEKFLPHALDLRCLVSRKNGEEPKFLGCLARVGEGDNRVAKNTALGAMPVGIDPPNEIKDLAIESVRAAISYVCSLGYIKPECLLLGVDIIPACWNPNEREQVYRCVDEDVYGYIERIKTAKERMNDELGNGKRKGPLLREYGENLAGILGDERFKAVLSNLDEAFGDFKGDDAYRRLQREIDKYLRSSESYVGEHNDRVDYAYQTRNLVLPLQEDIANIALSILN